MTALFEDLVHNFSALDEWEDKYAYLIDLGRSLPEYPTEYKNPAHEVPGCMSKVWMHYEWVDAKLNLFLLSDAQIVKGLMAILYSLYQGKAASDMSNVDAQAAFDRIGLGEKLTQNRRNGFVAVASRIKLLGQAAH